MTKRLAFKARGVAGRRAQRGATMIIGLIMIVLITLIVVNAFTMSSSNLKAVGNMQVRDEGIAAANNAIEQVISSRFEENPVAQTLLMDINKDGTNDYTVMMDAPVCTRAVVAGNVINGIGIEELDSQVWNTEWDIASTVTDQASGASVRVRQGVRVLLSASRRNLVCPAAAPPV